MVASYNSLPPEVVTRALEWLDVGALGRFSPCSSASNRCATAAFKLYAKRKFGALNLLGGVGRSKDWRRPACKAIHFDDTSSTHVAERPG